jgi:hypothetical protein
MSNDTNMQKNLYKKGGGPMEPRNTKTVIEVFKEKMAEKIEAEKDEKKKDILEKALHRGINLLEGE